MDKTLSLIVSLGGISIMLLSLFANYPLYLISGVLIVQLGVLMMIHDKMGE